MDQPVGDELISIIIPVYNTEKYLKECIDSVLAQSYDLLEIILVDDGSQDESGLLCDAYAQKDSRIKVIHQENQGLSAARQQGINYATGSYVMFVDSDDWVDADICMELYKAIQKYNVESAMCGYFRSYPERAIPRVLYSDTTILTGKEVVRKLCGPIGQEIKWPETMESLNTAYAKLYPLHVIREVKMLNNSEIGPSEDLVLNLDAFSKIRSSVYISNAYYYYRKTVSGSITSSYKQDLNVQWNRLYCYIRDYIGRNQYDGTYLKALENRIALNTLGLGLNCIRGNVSFCVKVKRLRRAMKDPIRTEALNQLSIGQMPFHWKVFYFCARKQWYIPLGVLLEIINKIRGTV